MVNAPCWHSPEPTPDCALVPAMLALPTLLSTLQGAALLAGRYMPSVRCSLASGGEAFLVPDASVPCVIFEDDQIAIVAKPAGKHISILDWASDGNVARSTADGALDPPIPPVSYTHLRGPRDSR